jgi:NAD(P)-dependent dehydrogenase (short-subunit alcohol dehydrogenase family)
MTTTPNLSGKIALITGASRGIGAALALGFAAAGAHVVLAARGTGCLEDLDDQIKALGKGPATLLPIDLARLDDVDKIGPTLAERFGRLDILIANAGMLGPLSPATHVKPKDWERVMNLNFTSNVRLVRSVDPLLRAASEGRAIFTTSSIADDCPAYWGPYAASKAALNAFVKTYAAENMGTNLKINAIHPGAVATKMLDEAFPGGASFPTKKPEDVVPAYLALSADDCSQHGEILRF